MHEFKHPKYYAALRAERRKLQASSLKLDHSHWGLPRIVKASSLKRQASEASSCKLQAQNNKPEASSRKLQAPRSVNHDTFE